MSEEEKNTTQTNESTNTSEVSNEEKKSAFADEKSASQEGQNSAFAEGDGKEEPIEYKEFNFGEDYKVDDNKFNEFKSFGSKNKFSQEQMQSIIDFESKRQTQSQEEYKQNYQKAIDDFKKNSVETVKNDKMFGGHNFEETKANFNRVLDTKYGFTEKAIEKFKKGDWDDPDIIMSLANIFKINFAEKNNVVEGETKSSSYNRRDKYRYMDDKEQVKQMMKGGGFKK